MIINKRLLGIKLSTALFKQLDLDRRFRGSYSTHTYTCRVMFPKNMTNTNPILDILLKLFEVYNDC